MDRYLYKAKRINNGEWVTGSLLTCEDGTCKIATSLLEVKTNGPILVCAYDVDRDTICQCIGLKDKNGKLIWENDVCDRKEQYPEIVKYCNGDWTLDYSYARVYIPAHYKARIKTGTKLNAACKDLKGEM